MAIIFSVGVLILLTICNARPPQPYESNNVFEVLRENGVDLSKLDYEHQPQPTPWMPTPPTTTTTNSTTPPPYTTTIAPSPTPKLKLMKKKVITIEDFETESEL